MGMGVIFLSLFSILLVGIATNLDNLCAAMALGVQKKTLPMWANLLIALISGVVAFVAAGAASFLAFSGIANLLGGLMLSAVGLWTLVTANRCEDTSGLIQRMDFKAAMLLGAALAINCLPVAFGAGATGLAALWVSLSIAVCSVASVGLGMLLGNKMARRLNGRWVNIAAGVLLVGLGILEALQ